MDQSCLKPSQVKGLQGKGAGRLLAAAGPVLVSGCGGSVPYLGPSSHLSFPPLWPLFL